MFDRKCEVKESVNCEIIKNTDSEVKESVKCWRDVIGVKCDQKAHVKQSVKCDREIVR